MKTEMTKLIIDRVNAMKKNIKIQEIMLQFATDKDAEEWLIKTAIATLYIKRSFKNE